MAKIVLKRELNDSVALVEVEAPRVARRALPGQFVMLRIDEAGERIPLTIAHCDARRGTVGVIFQKAGLTTRLLGDMRAGDDIRDFVGPLGRPTEVGEGVRRVCVVGGGVGCAIAYPQAKHLHARGLHVDVIAGFRSKDIVILEDELRAASTRLFVTTDDGSWGERGFVTDRLRALIDAGAVYDLVIAIGPVPMMKFVCETTRAYGIETVVSLNPIMVDGTGMCGGCRVTVGGRVRFACVDGPDFDGHEVDFDELMVRNALYREQEARAEKDHDCRMEALFERLSR